MNTAQHEKFTCYFFVACLGGIVIMLAIFTTLEEIAKAEIKSHPVKCCSNEAAWWNNRTRESRCGFENVFVYFDCSFTNVSVPIVDVFGPYIQVEVFTSPGCDEFRDDVFGSDGRTSCWFDEAKKIAYMDRLYDISESAMYLLVLACVLGCFCICVCGWLAKKKIKGESLSQQSIPLPQINTREGSFPQKAQE